MKYIKDRKCNPGESTKTECLHRNVFPRISSHGKKINLITKHRQHIFGDRARDEYRYLWFRWDTFKQANKENPNDSVSGSLFLANKLGNDPIWRRRVIRNSSAHSFSWSQCVISMTLKQRRPFSSRTKELNKIEAVRRETVPFCLSTFINRKVKNAGSSVDLVVKVSFHIPGTLLHVF